MKRLSILFYCVLLFNCEGLQETTLSGSKTKVTPINNVASIQGNLLQLDQNVVLEKLRESGIQITPKDLQLIINYLYAITPTLERLRAEMPESLKSSGEHGVKW